MLEIISMISVRRGASPQLWAFESWSSTPAAIHQPCHGMEGGTTIMEQICNSYIRYVRYVNWTELKWKLMPFYGKTKLRFVSIRADEVDIFKVLATEFPKLDPAIRYYLQPNLRQCRLRESYRKLEEHQLGTWQIGNTPWWWRSIQKSNQSKKNSIETFSESQVVLVFMRLYHNNLMYHTNYIGSMAEVLHQSGPAKWSSLPRACFYQLLLCTLNPLSKIRRNRSKSDPPILLQWHWGFFPKTKPSLSALLQCRAAEAFETLDPWFRTTSTKAHCKRQIHGYHEYVMLSP